MPIIGRMKGVTVLQHRLHMFAVLDGRPVFVKYAESERAGQREEIGLNLSSEKKALKALQGLAVPEYLTPSAASLRRLVARPPASVIVLERVPGTSLNLRPVPMPELFGFWAAITEQLAAFVRAGVLYSDIKASNVIASLGPPRVTIVDFNRVCPARPRRSYPASFIGYTTYCSAPEHGFTKTLTEASVVYQLGILWAQSVDPYLHTLGLARPGKRAALMRRVAAKGSPGLARLFSDCLERRPQDRPRSYEAVLDRLYRCGLPAESVRIWARLRAPYAARLKELGFAGFADK